MERQFDRTLATEMFHRSRMSAAIGILGIGIVAYLHAATYPLSSYCGWMITMLCIFITRILLACYSFRIIVTGKSTDYLVNTEAALCGLSGLGWGLSLVIFNSFSMDSLFYLRLIIIAAAMSFVVSSMTVYIRAFICYLLPMYGVAVFFLLSNNFIKNSQSLVFSGGFYVMSIIGVALLNNRRIRSEVTNQLAVKKMTEELNIALETERNLRIELSKAAITDELTGILNRRGILERFNLEISRCKRFDLSLAALMIDVDFFKQINDTHGHMEGDVALRSVVHSLQSALRDTDLIGRFGGEEFLVILPNLDQQGGLTGAERLRRTVENSHLELSGKPCPITVSIGVAIYRPHDDVDQLLARADVALYQAKQNGRNRVIQEST